MSGITASPASTEEIMSAVARDSPELKGEEADTPCCLALQKDWLGEGQLGALTVQKWWRVELGPPLVLPLHSACVKWKQHWLSASLWLTGWLLELKLMYERNNPLILSLSAGRWDSSQMLHLLPHPFNPSIHSFCLQRYTRRRQWWWKLIKCCTMGVPVLQMLLLACVNEHA